jgi:hypothetical protein
VRILSCVALICLLNAPLANAAEFDITFGTGFDDTTPMAPEGGNPGLTLGDARKNVLREAGRIWGTLLVSNVRISVQAQFVDNQDCMDTMATLASAGATALFRNFTGAAPNTFYVSPLANAIAGRDLDPAKPDINVNINSKVNGNSTCLSGRRFYYGFDHNTASITPRGIDLLAVALHELAHGFGFASEIDLTGDTAGQTIDGSGAVTGYVQQIFDEQLVRAWPMLTPAERVQSASRTGLLAWNGPSTNAQASRFLSGVTSQRRLQLNAPAMISEGSSVSHWSPDFANPDLLMEPNISRTLNSRVDVTVCALQDIGWQVNRCPDGLTNIAPVANSQTVSVNQGSAVTITLLATDPDGDPLSFSNTNPASGTLTGSGSQVVMYQPNSTFSGTDSFTFQANDGTQTSTPATVTVNVVAAASSPGGGTTPVPGGRGGGGGGAMNELLLAALALLAITARLYKSRMAARLRTMSQ